jgi:putative restriction endonuclease
VEGAHIIPWSESNNDDPRNGLSLCRTHHWMFDKLMLTIRDDYSIRLSYWVERNENRVEETVELKNNQILLPKNERYLPSSEALLHHNERFNQFHKEN